MPEPGISTQAVVAATAEPVAGQPFLAGPVFASAYHLPVPEDDSLDTYGRASNPSWRQWESGLAALEQADAALVFGSGMGTIASTLRALVRPGQTLLVPEDGYYQTRRYASENLAALGINVITATSDQIVAAAAQADVVVAETPSNPRLDVVDLALLARETHAQGGVLVVDNTTATPMGQRPLGLGADLVVASATKALSGHSDLIAGYVAGSRAELVAAVAQERSRAGAILGPFEAWLGARSLATAGLRFERQCQNALAVATMLREHPAVTSVRYPGLPGDPSYSVASAQMSRFGSLVSIELSSAEAVHALIRRSELLASSTSFGGVHTSVDRRARWGDAVPDGFARISLGIEDTDDLLADIEAALAAGTV
ncbi:cystathionine gamma-lyase [Mycobacteroides abscessus]|uniref:cystathionine gamma-lyase n=1 Tax=Mycobacteroides abscessus TaxID=36809 RepID=UPI0009A7A5F4|nr:cystathionine gamma-lyase [Mycobacteroides abscessus]SLC75991.1 Putative cystathionine/methionine gamma-synthase/ lyase [Mycobacteroides abscessus subsp. massiliense]SLE57162.1 Putative cystathionine/methionine gamma-synthase/ lyase [Mycobacteroides abscessus subsp. massiliense]